MTTTSLSNPPLWNIVSVALPAAAFVLGAIVVGSSNRSDFAGGLGDIFRLALVLGMVSVVGEGAAIAALFRGERMIWLSILGVVLNLVFILPAIYLWSRME